MDTETPSDLEPGSEIAIIGMTGRFPGARDLTAFWHNLHAGRETISFFANDEIDLAGNDPALLDDPNYVKAAGILDDIELFDAAFFGINPKDAEIMDPQHRLFLESAWEALEHAGYNSETYPGWIGVYAGVSLNRYLLFNLWPNRQLLQSMSNLQVLTANLQDHMPTQVSYKLNLRGPSVTVQTACSTSLVAVHMACQSLLRHECDIALAGGVTVSVPQKTGYLYQEGGTGSPDGHCRTFDAQARGAVSGSGVGVVVLKRLQDALNDRDTIHAVIKGSAINNDGSLKVGYTAPSEDGQAEVIAMAQALAGVVPEDISYIEAHGSATVLGDPIEIAALTRVFRESTDQRQFCAIGSVKTNIGHLETAAGVAGLIKTVLALKQRIIPPSLHFHVPNPQIDFATSPFVVNTAATAWNPPSLPRRAGVSSFGMGGTNAHVILEEAPEPQLSRSSDAWHLLLLSAKTPTALDTAAANLTTYLRQYPDQDLADVTYTLRVGRQAFAHRAMAICRDTGDALQVLETRDSGRLALSVHETSQRPVAFMFSGLGDQYENMTRGLYRHEPVFQDVVDRCCELLTPLLQRDLRDVLYPGWQNNSGALDDHADSEVSGPSTIDLRMLLRKTTQQPDTSTSALNQTAILQPALFVIEYALAQLWLAWGIKPQAMIGYSLGEYVAACLAGVFSLNDALLLVAKRAQLISSLPGGSMLSVPLTLEQLQPLLDPRLSIAAINAPQVCVVSGPSEQIATLADQLLQRGIASRPVQTTHAFHSRMMEPIRETFTAFVQAIPLHPPRIQYISNVTGTWITPQEATNPRYWATHLCETVRFGDGIATLWDIPDQVLLEIGPGQTLTSLALQHPARHNVADPVAVPSVRPHYDQQPDTKFILNTLGRLWLAGLPIDWSECLNDGARYRIPLPTYPFERQSYWIEAQSRFFQSPALPVPTVGKIADLSRWFYVPAWKPTFLISEEQPDAVNPHRSWLVFVDHGFGEQMIVRLRHEGAAISVVRPGDIFADHHDDSYTLNPRDPEEYVRLLAVLRERQRLPERIVHAWSLEPLNTDAAVAHGCYSLLFLAQALSNQNMTARINLWIVTCGSQSIAGEELFAPHAATMLGLGKVIGQEYPNLMVQSVDIVPPARGTRQEQALLDQLWTEFSYGSTDNVVAYRGHQRLVQHFEPVAVSAHMRPDRERVRQGGSYLITGGLGQIGLALATYLAETFQAKLTLISRSGLPQWNLWDDWLAAHGPDDLISQRITQVRHLEHAGAEVLVLSADVADAKAMHAAIAEIDRRFGVLHGVIHAAGIVAGDSFQTIAELTPAAFEEHFQSKVHALYVLEQVLQDRPLDFCMLTSSLSPILGGLGFAAYAAANSFMDAFVQRHNLTAAAPWMSINWADWHFDTPQQDERMASLGATVSGLEITPAEGVETFRRVLGLPPVSQVVISSADIAARLEQWVTLKTIRAPSPSSHAPQQLHQRPNLRNPYDAPTTELEQTLVQLWQSLLNIAEVGIHDNFFELGGNSLIGVQLIYELRRQLDIAVPLTIIYEGPTIYSLAKLIDADPDHVEHAGYEQRSARGERRRKRRKV